MLDRHSFFVLVLWSFLIVLAPAQGFAASKSELWDVWDVHDPASKINVDHGSWDRFLQKYVQPANSKNGHINRLNYKAVNPFDRRILDTYLTQLTTLRASTLNRANQMVYWINLYNALTVRVVLDAYPVDSIRDIDISPGLFSNGPWGKKLITVEGVTISLDDIEHRILRPIWNDARLHYVLNCAALGCPEIGRTAISVRNAQQYLNQAAHSFINHPRGVRLKAGKLVLSSIYDWYRADFGGTNTGILAHIRKYTTVPPNTKIKDFDYDWRLNGVD